jgi:S1-C subfamily serine protease
VVAARLALLDADQRLRAAYLHSANPVEENGLPVAPVTDVGPALVLRAQRRAFQLWTVNTPFARAGTVTIINAGDLGKEADLYPVAAIEPELAASQIATLPGSNTRLSSEDLAQLRAVAERARGAVVRLTDANALASGSGIIFDPSGFVLTNSHVVTAIPADRLRAILPDGRSFTTRVVGWDEWTDVAVVQMLPASAGQALALPSIPLGSAQSLTVGDRVIGIGYAPVLPGSPSIKTGTVRSLAGQIQVDRGYPLFDLIQTNTFIYPGDSGGPLLDLQGRVVGVNSVIQLSFVPRQGRQLTGYSIPVDGALPIAQQLIASGTIPRPYLGITPIDVTTALAAQGGLPVMRGVLIAEVAAGSPASSAGLIEGDIIVSMDGQAVTGLAALRRLLVSHKVGDTVSFTVVGNGQPRRDVSMTLSERPPLV